MFESVQVSACNVLGLDALLTNQSSVLHLAQCQAVTCEGKADKGDAKHRARLLLIENCCDHGHVTEREEAPLTIEAKR